MSVYTVAQINSYIRRMFCEDFLLQKLTVRGEVSGCKYHSSGHIYFTLKDESGVIACMMFRQSAQKLSVRIEDGRQYLVTGRIDVYEKGGRYQLYAEEIKPDGRGELYERYEALKARLAESGMFDESYKQPIPRYVRTLGVVTAPTGAAVRDIIHVARRRNPGIRIILYPAIVQGDQAAASIAAGIRALTDQGVDCMIVGRGGGSIEDLWAFNEEIVAQAIFDCPIPIISAVGHETDFTIADFVADLRAATPSAAAEQAVFDAYALMEELADLEMLLTDRMGQRIRRLKDRIAGMERELTLASPQARIRERRLALDHAGEQLKQLMERRIARDRQALSASGRDRYVNAMRAVLFRTRKRLDIDIERLEGGSPVRRLKSGYAHIADAEGRTLRSVRGIRAKDHLTVTMTDGALGVSVEEVLDGGKEE